MKILLEESKTQISKPSIELGFKPIKPLYLEDDVFVIAVFVIAAPHAFAADWLMFGYENLIEEVLQGVTSSPIKFEAISSNETNDDEKSVMDVLIRIGNRMARIPNRSWARCWKF